MAEMKQIARFIGDAARDFEANRDRIDSEVSEICARYPIYED